MIMFQAGDHFDLRLQAQEHVVVFIRFDHKRSCLCLRVH